MRTTQRKGDTAVAQAIATFTRLGYDVSVPLTESAAYDLVLDDGKKLYRLQVRYSATRDVRLRRIHSNSKGYVTKMPEPNSYDWLYAYCPDGSEYLIQRCVTGKTEIRCKPGDLLSQQRLPLDASNTSAPIANYG